VDLFIRSEGDHIEVRANGKLEGWVKPTDIHFRRPGPLDLSGPLFFTNTLAACFGLAAFALLSGEHATTTDKVFLVLMAMMFGVLFASNVYTRLLCRTCFFYPIPSIPTNWSTKRPVDMLISKADSKHLGSIIGAALIAEYRRGAPAEPDSSPT